MFEWEGVADMPALCASSAERKADAGWAGPGPGWGTGDGRWLSRLYREAVPHFRGSVVAQEIFEAKVFPGDTDLRVFRAAGLPVRAPFLADVGPALQMDV